MGNDRAIGELERFLAERADRLMRTAVLLTGSRDAGQDLLQAALERLLRHWRTLDGYPEGTCAARGTTWPRTAFGDRAGSSASFACSGREHRRHRT
jgi:hypothetical protein